MCLLASSFPEAVGGWMGNYMYYGTGARQFGMGRTGRTYASDANAVYWNSALLADVKDYSFSYMTTRVMAESDYGFIALSAPIESYGTFGFGYLSIKTPGLELRMTPSRDAEGYFGVGAQAMYVGWGKQQGEYNLGLTGIFSSRQVYTHIDDLFSLDASMVYKGDNFRLSGQIKHLLAFYFGDTNDRLKTDFELGAVYFFGDLMICGELSRLLDLNDMLYFFGVEYKILNEPDSSYSIRAGMNNNEVSIGTGVGFTPLFLDYAFIIKEYSQEHVFSFTVQFDEFDKNQNKLLAMKYYQLAIGNIKSKNYKEAFRNIEEGLTLNPSFKELILLRKRFNLLNKYIGLSFDEDNHSVIYQDALSGFLLGEKEDAIMNVEYLSQRSGMAQLYLIRDLMEKELDFVSKYKGKNIIQSLVDNAVAAIFINDLDKALELLEKAYYLEPINIEVLKRLGSIYYVRGDYRKARYYWEKAVRLEPVKVKIKDIEDLLRKLEEKESD